MILHFQDPYFDVKRTQWQCTVMPYTCKGYRLDVKINLPQDGQFVHTLSANRVPKRSETPILHTRRSRPLLGRVFSAFYNGPRPPFENWNLAFLCLNKFFPDKPISISIQSCCACVRISRECVPEVGGKSRGLALFWGGVSVAHLIFKQQ